MSGHQNQRADHRRLPSDATSKELDPYHTAVDGQQPADSDLSQEGNKEANDINSPEAQHVLYGPAPEGGLRAWLAAAGGGAVYFATLGFSNSFGTFEEYYRSHQLSSSSASKISWIGSLAIFLQFFTGMLSGPLFDRYGQKIIFPAAFAYVFAMMMLSLCKTYWEVMLVQGVLMGISMGLLQIPAFAAVSQYFEKNRAGALGLVASGSSIGGIVIPIALSKMLNASSLGFGWSVRIIGFMILPFMAIACIGVRPRLPPRDTQFWLLSAYNEPRYVILSAALFLMFFGMFTPFFYLPSYAISQGMDATLAGYLLSILNAASTFGRIIPGVLADKYGRINMFGFGGVTTGILVFCLNSATSNAGLIVYAIFFGFTSGTIVSGGSAAFSVCPEDPRNIGTYMGMGMAVAGIAGLVGPPANGALVTADDGYFQASMVSGALCTLGGILALVAKKWTPQGLMGNT